MERRPNELIEQVSDAICLKYHFPRKGKLRPLDQALHPLSWQAASQGHGRSAYPVRGHSAGCAGR